MEILVFQFVRPISNNKKNDMFAHPPWDAPGKKYFFLIFLINMEILTFMVFDGLIYNNKENK